MFRFLKNTIVPALLFCGVLMWAPVQANQVIRETAGLVELEKGNGVLIRLKRPANTVFVADPKIADIQVKSPRLIYVLGITTGETTLIAVDKNERVLTNRRIKVSHNLGRLRRSLKSMLPNQNIKVRSLNKSIVVSGSVKTPTDAADVRRMAEQLVERPENVIMKLGVTAPTQVNLRVRIAEVSRDTLKQFGINWDVLGRAGGAAFGITSGNPILGTFKSFTAGDGISQPTANFIDRIRGVNQAIAGYSSGSFDINGLIDALDEEGLITVLAEPNLTAMSGKPATFLAGGEFPIIVSVKDELLGIEFKEFGVSLAFTPTLLDDKRISLHVNPEVSEISTQGEIVINGFSIPSLTTRRAETTVELGNGQSFAIAGLIQDNYRHDIDKFPGLADIPILGTLFRSDRFRRNETELVIIVTPYIVRPVDGDRLALPTDGFTPPSDHERLVQGRLYHPTPRKPVAAPVTPNKHKARAPIGFVLD
jgi:pilus assembly protein CpaC